MSGSGNTGTIEDSDDDDNGMANLQDTYHRLDESLKMTQQNARMFEKMKSSYEQLAKSSSQLDIEIKKK